MKKRFKYLSFLLLAVIISTSTLFACGGGIAPRDYLIFYTWGSNAEIAWYEEIAAEYEREFGFPVRVQSGGNDYYNNLGISFNSSTAAPDIYITQEGEIIAQLDADRVLNLQPYIDNGQLDVVTSSNPDGTIELWDINDSYKWNGSSLGSGDYHALIKDWSADFVIWYNKDHFDTAGLDYPSETVPMTWSEFETISKQLADDNGCYGTMLDRSPFEHVIEFIQMSGESLYDNNRTYMNTGENVRQAFEFYMELQKGVNASAPKVGDVTGEIADHFKNGDVSMMFYGGWAYSNFSLDGLSFEFGLAPAPVPDNYNAAVMGDCYGVTSGMTAFAINKESPNPDKAVEFLNYYMTKGQEFFAPKGYNLPGNKLVADSDLFLYPDDPMLEYVNQFFHNYAQYTHPIVYNKYLTQGTVNACIAEKVDLLYGNYSVNKIGNTISEIAQLIRDEVDFTI